MQFGEEEASLNEPSFLASIEEQPGEGTSVFFTKVKPGAGKLIHNFSSSNYPHEPENYAGHSSHEESKKYHSLVNEPKAPYFK